MVDGSFYLPGDPRATEYVPATDQLSVHAVDRLVLDRFADETSDDPLIDLRMLSDTERRRLRFRILGISAALDPADYADEIATTIGNVDYFIVERQVPGASNDLRRIHDIALNLGIRGVPTLFVEAPGSDTSEQPVAEDSPEARISLTARLRSEYETLPLLASHTRLLESRGRPLPVVRTIGLSDYDPIPGFGLSVSDVDDYDRQLRTELFAGSWSLPNKTLVDRYNTSFAYSAPKAIALEQLRHHTISIIAANAVLRNLDKEVLRVGILQTHPTHTLLHSLFHSGKMGFGPHSVSEVPLITADPQRDFPLQDAYSAAMQEAMQAPDKRPGPEATKRLLVSDYVKVILTGILRGDAREAERAARIVNARLTAAGIDSVLDRIDDAKSERLGINWKRVPEAERRFRHLSKTVLKHPVIRPTLGGLDPA